MDPFTYSPVQPLLLFKPHGCGVLARRQDSRGGGHAARTPAHFPPGSRDFLRTQVDQERSLWDLSSMLLYSNE